MWLFLSLPPLFLLPKTFLSLPLNSLVSPSLASSPTIPFRCIINQDNPLSFLHSPSLVLPPFFSLFLLRSISSFLFLPLVSPPLLSSPLLPPVIRERISKSSIDSVADPRCFGSDPPERHLCLVACEGWLLHLVTLLRFVTDSDPGIGEFFFFFVWVFPFYFIWAFILICLFVLLCDYYYFFLKEECFPFYLI